MKAHGQCCAAVMPMWINMLHLCPAVAVSLSSFSCSTDADLKETCCRSLQGGPKRKPPSSGGLRVHQKNQFSKFFHWQTQQSVCSDHRCFYHASNASLIIILWKNSSEARLLLKHFKPRYGAKKTPTRTRVPLRRAVRTGSAYRPFGRRKTIGSRRWRRNWRRACTWC